jgi:site-specific DNA-methyltransferase (adenine-specific)/adenine-specific DNA-methyltransferase
MPTLEWIGKQAVVNHHREVPFHLLRCDEKRSVGDPDAGNLLVQGDNLLALKALLPYYAGQVKCIYIDPPYNTGNEKWVYNDAVNSPEIRRWLGKVVGREAEDLSRHDKWLCMMYPRLTLLRQFLRDDGAIFVSIDDNEAAHLRCIMDEIFGPTSFLCAFAWHKRYGPPPDTHDIGYVHETILAYRKSPAFSRNLLPPTQDQVKRYKNPDDDPRGPWKPMDYTCRYSKDERPNLYYPVTNPNTGKEVWPKPNRVWAFSREEHEKNVKEDVVWWGKTGKATVPAKKNFLSGVQKGIMPVSLLPYDQVGHTHEATKELQDILPTVKMTPKPSRLVVHLMRIAASKNALIMDSFAGSGTTGHAVLAANQADGGNRRFILVELEEAICQKITAERLSRVIDGYMVKGPGNKTQEVEGLGGGFRYCTLSDGLFDEQGMIAESVSFEDLAAHVYFAETGQPLPRRTGKDENSPLLGVNEGTAVYLLFNGVLGDKRIDGGNVLTTPVLRSLPPHDGHKVIYGEGCRLGRARLKRERITFKQIPYEVKVS